MIGICTFGGDDGIVCWCSDNFCDTFIQVNVLAVNVGKSVFDRALVHLQFNNLFLNMVGIQFSFGT